MDDDSFPQLPPDAPQDPTLSYIPLAARDTEQAPETACLATWATSAPEVTEVDVPRAGAAAPPPQTGAPAYELRRLLGRGGMGEVWEATQQSLGRIVAVKRALASREGQDTRRLREFQQEAIIAGRLEHPNIVPVHDLGIDPSGAPLLAMKLVRGRAWDRALAEDFPQLAPEDLLAKHLPVLIAVGHAVAFAHAQGIVHRDIKPAQVMTGEFGEALLMDWGLAVQVSDAPPELEAVPATRLVPTRQTASNPAGTIALMAPEQTTGTAERIGPWTDVYLLGATLYYLLTGSYPHEAATTAMAFAKATEGTVESPRQRAPKRTMPEELVELCLRSMQRDPLQRIAGAKEFVEAIQDYLGGASKRRESRVLVEQAVARLAAKPTNYAEFAAIAQSVERAATLWPENPAIAETLDAAYAAHTETALANGDLVLARTLAERILDSHRRAKLLQETERREARVRSQARQRRLLIGVSFAALSVIVVGGSMFAFKLDEQRKLAEDSAREATLRALEAKESRAQSDDLVQFMITDLSEKLAPLDEDLSALDEAAERAADYYMKQSLRPDRLDARERADVVGALLSVASVLTAQGHADRALAATERATAFAATLPAPDAAVARGLALVSHGQSLRRAGRLADAESAFDQVVALGVVESTTESLLARARALLARADLRLASGRTEPGYEDALEGTAIMASLMAEEGATVSRVTEYAWGAGKIVNALVAAGDGEGALAELRKTRGIVEPLLVSAPNALGVRAEVASSWLREGNILQELDRLEEALTANAQAVDDYAALATERPTDVGVLSEHAHAIARRGAILTELGRIDEALPLLERGLELRRQLSERDPNNRELLVRLRGSWQRLAEAHGAAERWAQAGEARQGAIAVSRRLAAIERSPNYVVSLASDLQAYAENRLRAGEGEAGTAAVREAIELLESVRAQAPRYPETILACFVTDADLAVLTSREAPQEPLERALEVFVRHPRLERQPGYVFLKSQLLLRLGRREEAKAAAEQAKALGLRLPAFEAYMRENGFVE